MTKQQKKSAVVWIALGIPLVALVITVSGIIRAAGQTDGKVMRNETDIAIHDSKIDTLAEHAAATSAKLDTLLDLAQRKWGD